MFEGKFTSPITIAAHKRHTVTSWIVTPGSSISFYAGKTGKPSVLCEGVKFMFEGSTQSVNSSGVVFSTLILTLSTT